MLLLTENKSKTEAARSIFPEAGELQHVITCKTSSRVCFGGEKGVGWGGGEQWDVNEEDRERVSS